MRVRDLCQIKNLEHFKLIAGQKGLDHIVENAVIFEYESIGHAPENYYKNDFIVSTLIFAKDRPELILSTIQKLVELGISGMAIKAVYDQTLPEEITKYADEQGLPIFLFSDTYIEDVIVSINQYMKSEENYSRYEKEFYELLFENPSAREISEKAVLMNAGQKTNLASMYLCGRNSAGLELISDILSTVSLRKNKFYIASDFRLYQFHQGLFILHNFYEAAKTEDYLQKYQMLLSRLAIPATAVVTGLSTVHEGPEGLGLCVRESYFACCYAQIKQQPQALFSDIGIYRFIFPMLVDKTCRAYYETVIAQIRQYDKHNHASIIATLCEYVKSDCDIKRTAEKMYQHPNTIRYRMQKTFDLLGGGSEQEMLHILYIIALMHGLKTGLLQEKDHIFFDL
jgi:sugar diacid utilization regulator